MTVQHSDSRRTISELLTSSPDGASRRVVVLEVNGSGWKPEPLHVG